ncbi:PEP/pyruvate-binding domain-containing protein [Nonomuraea longicatena]|uniref:Pyruvate, phosphate dikinase n=1 Tax=Nonomuraea longicatena TaxID=83682 RepID=A0ABP3ZRF6_9ACTN
MIVPLEDADADTSGGKAAALGALLRAGLPVPDGFVVPFAAYRTAVLDLTPGRSGETRQPLEPRATEAGRPGGACQAVETRATAYNLGPSDPDGIRRAIEAHPIGADVFGALDRALGMLGDPPVAVRSSAANEDTGQASAAGQHESFLAVRGAREVADAVRGCWASLFSARAVGYRGDGPSGELAMAVIVQRHLDAQVSGVMFTPSAPGAATEIEASWGLGPTVVEGRGTPDAYRVHTNGSVTHTVADKQTRLDRDGARLVVRDVPADDRRRPALDDATAVLLAGLGARIAALRGGPQDVEWAIDDDRVWILQARPITAALPTHLDTSWAAVTLPAPSSASRATALSGTPGSSGSVTGTARIVRGPGDFARVRPGDILVCPFTDPAWTPLLRIAAGVVTETGGVLSHAAIVAREHGIPAVLGVPGATSRLRDGTVITVDGTTGAVTATA